MRVKKIIPCVCIDHMPDVSDSVYYGMPQLKVSCGFDTGMQFIRHIAQIAEGAVVLNTNPHIWH